LVAQKHFLISVNILDIESPKFLAVHDVLLHECVLDLDLFPEDSERLMNVRTTELAIHHLKDGFKFVVELWFLDVGINDLQVDMLGEKFYRILNVDCKQAIPFILQLFGIHSWLLELSELIFDLLEADLVCQPRLHVSIPHKACLVEISRCASVFERRLFDEVNRTTNLGDAALL
jgi:hypothetical protein